MLERAARIALSLLLATTAACATRTDAVRPAPRAAESRALPPYVVAADKAVLRLDDDRNVRLAFPRHELPLRIREVRDDEAVVEIDGGVRVSGVVKLDALGVIVCTPGPVGDHLYAGNGNLLTLRSSVHGGQVSVGGAVVVRQRAYAETVPFAEQFRSIPFEATLPTDRLCAGPQPKRHAGTVADPTVGRIHGEPDVEDFPKGTRLLDIDKDTSLTLLDAPGGKPLHTLPATEWGFVLVWLKREGGFDLVAAGGGPYLLGWIPAREPRNPAADSDGLLLGGVVGEGQEGPHALYGQELLTLPMHKLPAGAQLQQLGVVRATLMRDGYGRVVGAPRAGSSYVIAAVDDDVTVEGWIETARLGAVVVPRAKLSR
jgi:hypothetical protein